MKRKISFNIFKELGKFKATIDDDDIMLNYRQHTTTEVHSP